MKREKMTKRIRGSKKYTTFLKIFLIKLEQNLVDLNLNYRKLRIYRIQEIKNENSMMTQEKGN